MSQPSFSRAGLAALTVLVALSIGTPSAGAANFVVSEAGDPAPGPCIPAACSLRDAVQAADANSEADEITFSLPSPTVIRLAGTPIDVDSTEGIAINGLGTSELTVTGDVNDNGSDAADTRIFNVNAGAAVSLSGLTLTEGRAPSGGAILGAPGSSIVISDSVLLGNRSLGSGGAVATTGSLTLDDSSVAGNSANAGGGISLEGGASASISRSTFFFNSAATRGAGIAVNGVAAGESVIVFATTIAQNSGALFAWGGGMFVSGAVDGQLAVRTSTISGNAAGGGAGVALGDFDPGSLAIGASGSISIENSTVASNTAGATGGGIYFVGHPGGATPVKLLSTIAGDNLAAGSPNDLENGGGASGMVDAALSLIEASDTPISVGLEGENIMNVDPALNPLTTNGGPTLTHLPDEDSPVIDRGGSRVFPGSTTDQRGRPRPVDNIGVPNAPAWNGTDIGAVEIGPLPPPSLGRCRGEEVTILALSGEAATSGTPGRDVILGTEGADDLRGMGGEDLICAAGGGDVVQSGDGNDTVLGSGGADRLFGQGGSDVVIGGDGDDRIGGAGGTDRLFGLAGSDRLGGGGGQDGLYGHRGRDELLGGGAADDLFGGPGPDRLVGGPRRDHLSGGPGRDVQIQ